LGCDLVISSRRAEPRNEDHAGRDIAVDGIVGIADRRGMVDASAGESATVSVLLDVPGDWLINCSTEDDYPALIFQVFDEESEGSQHNG
jgi:hypothetical protein